MTTATLPTAADHAARPRRNASDLLILNPGDVVARIRSIRGTDVPMRYTVGACMTDADMAREAIRGHAVRWMSPQATVIASSPVDHDPIVADVKPGDIVGIRHHNGEIAVCEIEAVPFDKVNVRLRQVDVRRADGTRFPG